MIIEFIAKPMNEKILNHLIDYGHITGKEAWDRYGSRSTSKRISELKRAGVKISTEYRQDKYGQRYAHYRLAGFQNGVSI